jgi:hypothetical protein
MQASGPARTIHPASVECKCQSGLVVVQFGSLKRRPPIAGIVILKVGGQRPPLQHNRERFRKGGSRTAPTSASHMRNSRCD